MGTISLVQVRFGRRRPRLTEARPKNRTKLTAKAISRSPSAQPKGRAIRRQAAAKTVAAPPKISWTRSLGRSTCIGVTGRDLISQSVRASREMEGTAGSIIDVLPASRAQQITVIAPRRKIGSANSSLRSEEKISAAIPMAGISTTPRPQLSM